MQAPTRYDAREFLLDLFAEFCRQVIGPQGSADVIRSVEQGDGTQLWQHRLLARAMVLAGTGAVLAALAWPQLSTAAASAAGNPRLVVGVLGGLVAGAGLVLMWRRSRLRRVAVVPETVTGLARRHLETLTYLRTHSREWAATGRATALHLARKRGLQHAARAHTYPELVREFRTFVETVGLDRRAQYGDEAITTICIDELDKIGSAEEAENFLNEIKAIFGVSNTHYLISISKEALVSFDRRALGVRATFDSSFDLVLTMSLLRFAEARELLAKRLTRMPEPFVALCYSLSGGLPRDLLRMARDLQDTTAEDADGDETPAKPPPRPLAPLAERLIDGDVRGIIEGQVLHLGRVPSPAARPALRWMVNVTNAPLSADTLLGAAIKPPDVVKAGTETADCAEVVRLTQQTAAYFYLAATLRALFCDRPAGLAAWMREHEDETEVLDGLAAARADLSTHPLTTWHRLREVRRRFRLAIHDYPFG